MTTVCVANFIKGPLDGGRTVLTKYMSIYRVPLPPKINFPAYSDEPTDSPNLRCHVYEADPLTVVRNGKEILIQFIYKGEES